MLSITLQMSQHLIDRLDTTALADGIVSRSELVRIACEEYLRRRGKRVGGLDGRG
jgi:metal-responsive CopG/Arc/MetJ family transcriptional regulator